MKSKYPHLNKFQKKYNFSEEILINAFEIEREFHQKILTEPLFEKRQKMYSEVYNAVHILMPDKSVANSNDKMVRIFDKELKNKSVLDVGCGTGRFLKTIACSLPHKKLVGIDISVPNTPQNNSEIDFRIGNIVNFDVGEKFDVVYSNQVIEHIAPADIPVHLVSITRAMKDDAIFILRTPNRLFGPCDITRIIDFTYTGKIAAQGTHINEATYTEIIPILKESGFTHFRTICYLSKINFYLKNARFSTAFPLWIERHSWVLNLMYSSRFIFGKCIIPLDIILICRKKNI